MRTNTWSKAKTPKLTVLFSADLSSIGSKITWSYHIKLIALSVVEALIPILMLWHAYDNPLLISHTPDIMNTCVTCMWAWRAKLIPSSNPRYHEYLRPAACDHNMSPFGSMTTCSLRAVMVCLWHYPTVTDHFLRTDHICTDHIYIQIKAWLLSHHGFSRNLWDSI